MSDAPTWQPATLAQALGVPDEAFRAFLRLRGIGWDASLAVGDAAGLALAWLAMTGAGGSGPIVEAAQALLVTIKGTAPA